MLPKTNVAIAVTNAIIEYDIFLFFDNANVCTSQNTDVTEMTVVVTEMKNMLSGGGLGLCQLAGFVYRLGSSCHRR